MLLARRYSSSAIEYHMQSSGDMAEEEALNRHL